MVMETLTLVIELTVCKIRATMCNIIIRYEKYIKLTQDITIE